jgi:hypothetical protein
MSEETVQPPKPVSEPATTFKFNPDADGAPSPFPSSEAGADAHEQGGKSDEAITWTASEYIAHRKNPMWYAAVITIAALLALITFAITRDKISTITILIVGILFCVAAGRKPRILTYTLDHDGLKLGPHFHPYGEYRSFSIVRQGPFASIDLLPLKRFLPLTSIYFAPEDEEKVIDMISEHIPFEERSHALIDRFMRQIRF